MKAHRRLQDHHSNVTSNPPEHEAYPGTKLEEQVLQADLRLPAFGQCGEWHGMECCTLWYCTMYTLLRAKVFGSVFGLSSAFAEAQ